MARLTAVAVKAQAPRILVSYRLEFLLALTYIVLALLNVQLVESQSTTEQWKAIPKASVDRRSNCGSAAGKEPR
jgi:hypothetical protein